MAEWVSLRVRRFCATAIVAVALSHASTAFAFQKTDVVVLRSGDRVTCEVRTLENGLLTIKTDDMGTIHIEWDKIRSVVAKRVFEVETTAGVRLFGSLADGGSGQIAVVGSTTTTLRLLEFFRIAPIEHGFWHHLEGSINAGGSYTQSSGIGQLYGSLDVTSRRRNYEANISYDSTTTFEENQPDSGRYTGRVGISRYIERWILLGFGQLESNEDLGLKLRSSAGGGVGRNLLQSTRSVFQVVGGLAVSREDPVDAEGTTNLDGLAIAKYSAVKYDYPKSEVAVTFAVLPSFSDLGRVRMNFNAKVSRAILTNDFNFAITAFDDYDNRPPTATAQHNDFGVSFSIGWMF